MEEYLLNLLQQFPIAAPVLFIIARTLPVILSPIPGLFVDLIGINIFGWKLGLVLATIGVYIGAMIAFYIGRYFREPAIKRFSTLRKFSELEEKYSENQRFWMLVAIRLITRPFFDYVSYAAGLTKMKPLKFLLSTFLGTFPLMFSIYYFGGLTFDRGLFFGVVFFVAIFILSLVFTILKFGFSKTSYSREKAKEAIQERNTKRKQKILELVEQKEKITNNDVEQMLNVSDATARNYLDDLEKENKLKQIGKEGRGVYYVLNK